MNTSDIEYLNGIAETWNGLSSDKEKWEYLAKHPDHFELALEEQQTGVSFHEGLFPDNVEDDVDLDIKWPNDFEHCIGKSLAVRMLLDTLGIKYVTWSSFQLMPKGEAHDQEETKTNPNVRKLCL